MQVMAKIISSQQKLVNNFIHFKLIVSSIIRKVENYLMKLLIFNETWFFLTANSTIW